MGRDVFRCAVSRAGRPCSFYVYFPFPKVPEGRIQLKQIEKCGILNTVCHDKGMQTQKSGPARRPQGKSRAES